MSSQAEKVTAIMIFEAMGRPKEHLKDALKELVDNMEKEKGVKITEVKMNEPVLVKDQKDLYTNFAEVEMEAEGPEHIAGMMFKFMPSNVEIVEPENLKIASHVYSDILSEITRRLHKYDEIARVIQMEKQVLENKIKELEKK
jgi:hypothetical protein